MIDFENLRQEYRKNHLDETDVLNNPLDQFLQWFEEARHAHVPEPNAMTLSTVDINGKPSSRVVLLKGVSDGGFVFYSNYLSHKAKEIESNPNGCINFLWLELERQIRISGIISKISRAETEEYFHSRPRGSQIGAWVSQQSNIIESRFILEKNLEELEKQFSDIDIIPVPEFWGGYRLLPETVEFWQGRPNRLHDRILYSGMEGGHWKIDRLSP